MLRLRRAPAPPPIVAPRVNSRVALLVDGARYGGRVDDIDQSGVVIAAPDLVLSPERPLMLEWRDGAGLWQMPVEVVSTRLYPFATTTVRPTGASECIQSVMANGAAGIRLTARVVNSERLPAGTRVPVTTVNLRGDRVMLWTILPLDRGDQLDCMASLSDSRLVRVRCLVTGVETQAGTWLVRAECSLEEPKSAGAVALLTALNFAGDSRSVAA